MEGLITAAAAMVLADVYGRSVLFRSMFSRFMMDKIPLCLFPSNGSITTKDRI